MKIGVIGYGHFAGVVCSCLSLTHDLIQRDESPFLIRDGQTPVEHEPGWADLMQRNRPILMQGNLDSCDLVWIAYDVPLDADGLPVVDEILARIQRLDATLPKTIPFLVSCQWPVGTTRKIAQQCEGRAFVYVMENVRVGKAIADFQANPISICGVNAVTRCAVFEQLCSSVSGDTLWMSWESAELTKHTTNAFMALQIAFVNEIARVAESVGALPADVARGLRSDARVSPQAPLRPGGPFGGGSLKRDLLVLEQLRYNHGLSTPILDAILDSNGIAETLHSQPA